MYRKWVSSALVVMLFLQGCGSSTDTQSSSYVSCTAVASSSGSNPVSIYVYGYGGTAPYTVSYARLGTAVATLSGSTNFTSSTTVSATFPSTTDLTTGSGSITIVDSSETQLTNSCVFTLGTSTTTGTTTTAGGMSCTVDLSSSPSTAGNYITATANISSGSGGWLDSISYSSGSGVTGYYLNSTSAKLYFSQAGTYTINMLVRNSAGNWGSCSRTHVVY